MDSCSSQSNCTSCNAFSTCHWCSFDDACHTVGSLYGCLVGTTCYSIDTCFREEPEPAPPLSAGTTVATVVIVLALISCCCATCWLGIARSIKVTFQELLFRNYGPESSSSPSSDATEASALPAPGRSRPSSGSLSFFEMKHWSAHKKKRSPSLELGEDEDMSYDAALMGGSTSPASSSLAAKFSSAVSSKSQLGPAKYGRLPSGDEESSGDEEAAAEAGGGGGERESPRAAKRPVPPKIVKFKKYPASPIDCVWNCCVACYIFVIFAVVILSTASLVMWPQYPQYNLCSDELDWKSVVDGMTSAKMQASFELLMSVYNPNHFDIDILSGTGTFHHDGVLVGTFDMGEIEHKISSLSITDVLLTVTFTTDQWQALALSSEYYKGTLTFLVDANVAFAIPAFKYTSQSSWHDYFVHVGDEAGDRSLCACPEWS